MKIALAGATGLIGNLVVQELQPKANIELTTLTRRSLSTEAPHHNIVIDWDQWEPNTTKESLDADIFICCLGTTIKSAGDQESFKKVDFGYVKKFAEAAQASGAHKFIFVSANGANAQSSIFYNRVKGEAEEMLQTFKFSALAILRPSLLIGKRQEKRFSEGIAQAISPHLDFLLQGSLRRYQSIRAEQVAHVICSLCECNWQGLKVLESDSLKSGKLA